MVGLAISTPASAQVDLVVTSFTAPSTVSAQTPVAISWTVENQGASGAPNDIRDSLYLSTDTVIDGGDIVFRNGELGAHGLASGASYTINTSPQMPAVAAGPYYLIVHTDVVNETAESNEGNNIVAIAITVQVADLVPTSLVAPSTVVSGTSFGVSWTVQNQGSGTIIRDIRDSLFLSTNTVIDGGDFTFYSGILSAPGLAPGASYTNAQGPTMPTVPPGPYYLIVRANSVGEIHETNTLNDELAVPVTVQAQVCGDDVVVGTEECDLGGANGSPSSCCTASCQLRGAGQTCRPMAGDCDTAETCDGASPTCPADGFAGASTVCRSAVSACDVAEQCPGNAAACPPDQVAGAGLECRAVAGICDLAESCDGVSNMCPGDTFKSSAVVCRPFASACDLEETCTGSAATCPADTGLPDTDGDTVCDAIDNCPDDPNTSQANNDLDPLGDACDPCTGGASPTKHKLTMSKLLAPAGDDKFTLSGQAVLATLTNPPLDPVANGVRLLIVDNAGGTVLDTTVTGGAYDTGTKTGWKVNGSQTSFTYKNPGTHPDGIIQVGVKRITSTPGLVKVKVKGKNDTYTVVTANLPLHATLVLDPPTAETGECVEATWPATPPAKPSCVVASAGGTVKCK